MIYLDNAATTYPKPQNVANATMYALKKLGANPGRSGHNMSINAALEIYECRKSIAKFFNAKGPECVVFTLNCTHAINLVFKGLLKPGDHVVVSCLEHNAITRPLKALEEKGITFSEAKVFPGDNEATLDSFRNAINSKTVLIACTHASNVWGIRLPISRICAMAHEYGIPMLVDAAQSAGHIPIDLQETQIDYLCLAGHKGLYGPMGTGILITSHGEELPTIIEGGTGINSETYVQTNVMPEKFESGTQNLIGIAGLHAGIKFLNTAKVEKIAKHEHDLINYLYERLSELKNVELYMSRPDPKYFVPLLSFNVVGMHSENVGAILNKHQIYVRPGLHCAPAAHRFCETLERGAVRVCPSAFTRKSDIDALIEVVKKIKSN
ncbi:MAG: cysteine desulfurase [Acutalibacteraceae bacterium]